MPLVFLNGGAPDYAGHVFTTTADLIDTLETYLQMAGWTTVDKPESGLSLFMKGTTTNNHSCYVDFTVSDNSSVNNGYYLDQIGYHDSAKSLGSPVNVLRHTFIEGKPNKMWLAADNDSGCLCILDASGAVRGSHFGFVARLDVNDPWAWMIGWIHVYGYSYCYVAKSGYNSTSWRRLSDDYYAYTSTTNGADQTWPASTWDFMQQGNPSWNGHLWNDTRNAFYNPAYGRLNYTGRPVITPYCYQEGRGANNNYTAYVSLYFRGYVKHAYCGVASLEAASQVVDSSGIRVMSVGSAGNWQGMRIE